MLNSSAPTLEKEIEAYLVKQVKRAGGMAWKFQSEGHAGVPDRIVFWPDRTVEFVEVKRPGGKLRPLQVNTCTKISRFYHAHVFTVCTKHQVDCYVNHYALPRFCGGEDWGDQK